jgi:hypothetical protein
VRLPLIVADGVGYLADPHPPNGGQAGSLTGSA